MEIGNPPFSIGEEVWYWKSYKKELYPRLFRIIGVEKNKETQSGWFVRAELESCKCCGRDGFETSWLDSTWFVKKDKEIEK